MKELQFDCSRTCPSMQREACKFSAVFARFASRVVNSHTTTVQIEFRDKDALGSAVEKLGGHCLGEGKHALYSSTHTGFGFQLPGWKYPVIATKDGSLHYDSYQGEWGNEADIRRLTAEYAIEAARNAALLQGWVASDQVDGSLLIYHPTGGTMTVQQNGTVETAGFTGQGCDAASVIENALGSESVRANKAEYYAEHAMVQAKAE